MREYHKIQTIYKRDEKTHKVIEGQFSLPEFEYLKNAAWVFTEKVDGTNIWDGEAVTFGGKTDNAQIPAFLAKQLQDLFLGTEKELLFRHVFSSDTSVCLHGEGYGALIRSGALSGR